MNFLFSIFLSKLCVRGFWRHILFYTLLTLVSHFGKMRCFLLCLLRFDVIQMTHFGCHWAQFQCYLHVAALFQRSLFSRLIFRQRLFFFAGDEFVSPRFGISRRQVYELRENLWSISSTDLWTDIVSLWEIPYDHNLKQERADQKDLGNSMGHTRNLGQSKNCIFLMSFGVGVSKSSIGLGFRLSY